MCPSLKQLTKTSKCLVLFELALFLRKVKGVLFNYKLACILLSKIIIKKKWILLLVFFFSEHLTCFYITDANRKIGGKNVSAATKTST